MRLIHTLAATLCALFAALPAMAQQTTTGPTGLAEPTAPVNAPGASSATPAQSADNILDLDLSTGGRVRILLRPDKAPLSVERIKTLARHGFYDGLTFHRVIEGFMAQTGDPHGDGSGGSTLPDLQAEFNDLPHLRGSVAMARAEQPNSANSQFYIMFQPRFSLDHRYTVIGRVIEGMNYVDLIQRGEPPANRSKIVRAEIEGDHGRPVLPPLPAAPAPPPPAALPTLPHTAPPAAPAAPAAVPVTPPAAPPAAAAPAPPPAVSSPEGPANSDAPQRD